MRFDCDVYELQVEDMLEGNSYTLMDVVFPFLAAFIDLATRTIQNLSMNA